MKASYKVLILVLLLQACSGKDERSDAYGNFEVDDVIISAEANGNLLQFNIEEGKKLKKGELVGVIDSTNLVLKKKQLLAQKGSVSSNMDNINAQIEVQVQKKANLNVDKNRIEKMLKDGAATQKQLDDINGQLDLVEKQIASIKTQKVAVNSQLKVINAQIAQVEESIGKCRIINPMNGIVLGKFAEEHEVTAFGKPLYKIAGMDEVFLRVYVSGAQLAGLKIGQPVQVLVDRDKKTDRALNGTLSWISDNAEFTPKIIQTKEERVNLVYAVKIRVKNDGTLKIGMPGEANFIAAN